MFSDFICENWDSTKAQDEFIKSYFNVKEDNWTKTSCPLKSVVKSRNISITKDHSSNASNQYSEDSSSNSHLLKNKRSLNCQLKCNKKRKKEEKSLLDPSQEYHSEIQSQLQNIQMAEPSNQESNHVKRKKKKLKNKNISNEFSEKIKVTEDSNAETKTTYDVSANLISEIDSHETEIDSSCLKLKKKKKKLGNKANGISVPSETDSIINVDFDESSITRINSPENNSGYNKLKVKKRKKKLQNTEKSSEPDNFSDGVEISTMSDDSCIRENNLSGNCLKKKKKKIKNFEKSSENDEFTLEHTNSSTLAVKKSNLLQNKAYQKLQAAKFRYLNEMLYTNSGKDALSYFQQNTDEFVDYHQGYQSQVSKWPVNPVDIIIQEISQINKQAVIADLGCGEAKIAEVFPKRKVHSFDLIALKDCVTACDMTNVPLPSKTVDVVVFCLSLMGTNWKDYLKEAHRILKLGSILKIAEIESRIENLQHFIKEIEHLGFSLINQNLSHKMFIFLNFKKVNRNKKPSKVPAVTLKPCLYKKR